MSLGVGKPEFGPVLRFGALTFVLAFAWIAPSAAEERPPALKPTFLNPPPRELSSAEEQRGHAYRQGLQSDVRRLEGQRVRGDGLSPTQRAQQANPRDKQRIPAQLQATRQELNRIKRALEGRRRLAPAVGPLSPSGRPPLSR